MSLNSVIDEVFAHRRATKETYGVLIKHIETSTTRFYHLIRNGEVVGYACSYAMAQRKVMELVNSKKGDLTNV